MEKRVCVVTVTYGNRWNLLERLLAQCEGEAMVSSVVVVDNGCPQAIAGLVAEAGYKKVSVIRRETNGGSAVGFNEGLSAVQGRSAFVLLLDDDNVPEPGCVDALLAEYEKNRQDTGELLVVLALRPDRRADIMSGVSVARWYPPHDSFLGFHVLDLPRKVWARTPLGRPRPRELSQTYRVPFAPYSGMFFCASLMDRIGLPDKEFVLYSDDTEFSHRVTRAGGHILLSSRAIVRDLEASWNLKSKFRSAFDQWLAGAGDVRAYYACRNQVHFEKQFWTRRNPIYSLNRAVYMQCMAVRARQLRAGKRFALLQRAVADGLNGTLGISNACPRPE